MMEEMLNTGFLSQIDILMMIKKELKDYKPKYTGLIGYKWLTDCIEAVSAAIENLLDLRKLSDHEETPVEIDSFVSDSDYMLFLTDELDALQEDLTTAVHSISSEIVSIMKANTALDSDDYYIEIDEEPSYEKWGYGKWHEKESIGRRIQQVGMC